MANFTFEPYSGLTPNEVKQRYGYGSNLLKQGSEISPVGHWTQAIARGLQGITGGYISNYAGDQEREGQGAVGKVYQALMSGQATPQQGAAALMNTGGWGNEQGQQLANQVIKQRMAQSDPMLDLKRKQILASMDAEKRRLSIAEGQAARQGRLTDAQLAQMKNQTPEYRAQIAEQYGLKPGSPEYRMFVLQKKLPMQQANSFGRSGTIIQDKAGNFFSVQFGADGTRKVEPLQMGQTPLQPSKGTEVVGDTLRDKATGRVIENVGSNIAGAERSKIVGRNDGQTEVNFPKAMTQFRMAEQKWARVQPSIERARQMIRSNPTVVGLIGTAAARIPGSAAYRLSQYLETIKSNIGFSELQAMREASPNGGALGQVTEFENRLLQAVQGSLQQGLDGPTLLQNLNEIDLNLRQVRSITSDAFRQTYGNRGSPAQPAQQTTQQPSGGTYNWTPNGGLQRAR